MKKKKVVVITVAILLVIVLGVAAALLLKSDTFGMNKTERNKAVATVGGDGKVTANELAVSFQNYYGNIDTYNQYALYYGYGEYHDVSTPEGVESLRREILDELVTERAYVAMAKENGITLSAEEKAEAAQAGKEAYDTLIDQYTEQYSSYGYADPKNYAVTSVAQYFTDSGIGNKSEFIRRNTASEEASLLSEKLSEKLKGESGITAEQAESLYPDWASYYEGYYYDGVIAAYDEYFAQGLQNIRYLYIPEEGFVFLRVIELNDKERAEALAAEIGTDAELFEKYCGNKDAKSEENLNALMGLVAADDSYAISATDSSFDAAVYEAVAAMNVGDIRLVTVTAEAEATEEDAEPVSTYYIVRRVEGTTGLVPFEKVKDIVSEDVVNDAQTTYASEQVAAWIAEEGNVVIDEDVYAMVREAA